MKKLLMSTLLLAGLSAFASGGNIGSSGKSTDFISTRCNSAVGILINARERGDSLWSRNSNHPEIVVTYLEGKLNEANEKMNEFKAEFSLIKRSIERALDMLDALKNEPDLIDPKDQLDFLRNVYSFILDGVVRMDGSGRRYSSIVDLDRDHRTFRNGSKKVDGKWVCKLPQGSGKDAREVDCQTNEIQAWEKRYIEFIGLEIEWFLNTHLGFGVYAGNNGKAERRIESFGNTKRYTIPAELMTSYLIDDFKETLWDEAFECSKQTLIFLGENLANFNQNSKDADGPVELVRSSYNIFRRVQADAKGCGTGR